MLPHHFRGGLLVVIEVRLGDEFLQFRQAFPALFDQATKFHLLLSARTSRPGSGESSGLLRFRAFWVEYLPESPYLAPRQSKALWCNW